MSLSWWIVVLVLGLTALAMLVQWRLLLFLVFAILTIVCLRYGMGGEWEKWDLTGWWVLFFISLVVIVLAIGGLSWIAGLVAGVIVLIMAITMGGVGRVSATAYSRCPTQYRLTVHPEVRVQFRLHGVPDHPSDQDIVAAGQDTVVLKELANKNLAANLASTRGLGSGVCLSQEGLGYHAALVAWVRTTYTTVPIAQSTSTTTSTVTSATPTPTTVGPPTTMQPTATTAPAQSQSDSGGSSSPATSTTGGLPNNSADGRVADFNCPLGQVPTHILGIGWTCAPPQ